MNSKFKIQNSKFIAIFLGFFVLVWSGQIYAQTQLKAKMPDLCYRCHKELKKELSKAHVHVPVKKGQCSTCHNPHTSNQAFLINDEINPLCMGCHKGTRDDFKKESVHTAFQRGKCTDCHNPHSANYRYLLTKAENTLCLDCHEATRNQFKQAYLNPPFKEGKCLSCHHAHASYESNQLVKSPNRLCQSCHGIGCELGGISLSFALRESDCTTCHSGHSSNSEGIFNAYAHSAFLEGNCEECHNPILAEKEITTVLVGKELCFSCHEEERRIVNNINIHMGDVESACILCHNPHASSRKDLISKQDKELCLICHQDTERRQILMEKRLKSIRCSPVKGRKCLECHKPPHYGGPLYLKAEEGIGCDSCHKAQHTITHPIGEEAIDPRTEHAMNCGTCHSIHDAKHTFMLYYDRDRELCIQCHKR